jgi:ribulose-phosphate 3-epimerase
MSHPHISASILNADFGRLGDDVSRAAAAGVDSIHLDVMDGHFVDNLTFGPDIVAAFRRLTTLPLDVHLMIEEPSRYIDRFIEANPETITFHVEVPGSPDQHASTLRTIHDAGLGAGLAVSPETEIDTVRPYVDLLDIIMIMTVEPGWGGQGFLPDAAAKIGPARELLDAAGRKGLVHVDGGVNHDTAAIVGSHGVDVCIVGSALFQRGRDAAGEIEAVRGLALAGRTAGPGLAPAAAG